MVSSSNALRVVHVFRAPLGGLFRHVIDLSVEQAKRGLDVADVGQDCLSGLKEYAVEAVAQGIPIRINHGIANAEVVLEIVADLERTLRK